jgi:hypothetical protein
MSSAAFRACSRLPPQPLVKCSKESAGKLYGFSGHKIGNAFLKWAFSEAAVGFLRCNQPAQKYHDRLVRKFGKGKALSILAHRLGRAVYHMLVSGKPFDSEKFFKTTYSKAGSPPTEQVMSA